MLITCSPDAGLITTFLSRIKYLQGTEVGDFSPGILWRSSQYFFQHRVQELRKKEMNSNPFLFMFPLFYPLAEIRIPFSNCRDLHPIPYGVAIPTIMDTIIVPEGFGIIPISWILGLMINPKDCGESPRGNRLAIRLGHICHVFFPNWSKMMPAE